ncbi:MAG: InlB B-repeat-containing protein [Fibrobacterales bacterium]
MAVSNTSIIEREFDLKYFHVFILVFTLVSTVFSQTAIAPSFGDGSEKSPYQIASLENLYWLSQNHTKKDVGFYVQTADIDAAASQHWDGGKGFYPIGKDDTNPFSGVYDGSGFSIDNLTISTANAVFVGLFGVVQYSHIINLSVTNVLLTGNHSVGAVAGMSIGGSISNCSSSGTVNGSYAGGLVGVIQNTSISNSSAIVEVSGVTNVGGLIGYIEYEGSIINSYSRGEVTGTAVGTGGLVGFNEGGTIKMSYSTGKVIGVVQAGGLVGLTRNGNITNSFWAYDSSGQTMSSGGTGVIADDLKNIHTFTDTSTVGLDSAWDYIGHTNQDTVNGDIWIVGTDEYPEHTVRLTYETNDQYSIQGDTVQMLKKGGNAREVLVVPNFGFRFVQWSDGNTENPREYGTVNRATRVSAMVVLKDISLYKPDGVGSLENPYQIASLVNLFWLSQSDTAWDKNFVQTEDINASDTKIWGSGFKPIGNDTISFTGAYSGSDHTIEELTIQRFKDSFVGMFGKVTDAVIRDVHLLNALIEGGEYKTGGIAAEINNSVISNSHVSGVVTGVGIVGGLVGYAHYGTIINCSNSGAITTSGNRFNISVGGVVGKNESGTISNCFNSGNVVILDSTTQGSSSSAGGVVGNNLFGSITSSYNSGSVSGHTNTGGIVGTNFFESIIQESYNTGTVTGKEKVGGGVGLNNGEVFNSYSTGAVMGTNGVGGFIGKLDQGVLVNSYSVGLVQSTGTVGGLVADTSKAVIIQSFWNTETSGHSVSSGGTGKSIIQLQALETFTDISSEGLDSAWDFTGTVADDLQSDDIWSMNSGTYPELSPTLTYSSGLNYTVIGDTIQVFGSGKTVTPVEVKPQLGYAFVQWSDGKKDNPRMDTTVQSERAVSALVIKRDISLYKPTGTGTANDPYLIANLGNLYWLSEVDTAWHNYFLQTADINAAKTRYWYGGAGINSIGNSTIKTFTGVYDGGGHVIDSVYSFFSYGIRLYEKGLFGALEGAEIKNVGLTNVYIAGHEKIGALVGRADKGSTIRNSYSTGEVMGYADVGGLVGRMEGGSINTSYSRCAVTNYFRDFSGGLVGSGYTVGIYNSYAAATLGAESGGLVGHFTDGQIINSYSVSRFIDITGSGGLVASNVNSIVKNSFWNTDSAHGIIGGDGIGKTSTEMQDISLYTNTGSPDLDSAWDFISNPHNDTGNTDVWTFEMAGGYPVITAQLFTFRYNAEVNGQISGLTIQKVEFGTQGTEVVAIPDEGYHFVVWSDGVLDSARQDTIATKDSTVTAQFEINKYPVSYSTDTGGIVNGDTVQSIEHGSNATPVTAVASTGFKFLQWSDGILDTLRTDVSITKTLTVSAEFEVAYFSVEYHVGDFGTIIKGDTNQRIAFQSRGTEVTVEPDSGYIFTGWTDGSTANPRLDTGVTTTFSVTAQFEVVGTIIVDTIGQDTTLGAIIDSISMVDIDTLSNTNPDTVLDNDLDSNITTIAEDELVSSSENELSSVGEQEPLVDSLEQPEDNSDQDRVELLFTDNMLNKHRMSIAAHNRDYIEVFVFTPEKNAEVVFYDFRGQKIGYAKNSLYSDGIHYFTMETGGQGVGQLHAGHYIAVTQLGIGAQKKYLKAVFTVTH